MWRWFPSVLLLLLAACGGPSPHFAGAAVTRIAVDGSVFDVRVRGNLAEAVRVNSQYAPRFGPIRARSGFAMAQVSGCRVLSVLGDQAVATGRLACGKRDADWVIPVFPATYTCVDVGAWLNRGPGPNYPEFDCDPD